MGNSAQIALLLGFPETSSLWESESTGLCSMEEQMKIYLFVSIAAHTQHRWGLELLLNSGVDIDGVIRRTGS